MAQQAAERTAPHSLVFANAIAEHVSQSDDPLTTLWSLLTSDDSALLELTGQALLLGHLHGREHVNEEHKRSLASKPAVTVADLPFDEAIDHFRQKQILPPNAFYALQSQKRREAFTVTGLHKQYMLEHAKDTIADALEQGHARQDVVHELQDSFDRWGVTPASSFHLETVYRTNVLSSYAEGRYKQARAVAKSRPYWRYMTVGDARVRPAHRAMHGRVYHVDDPIWDSWTPPCGFNCRCEVQTLSQREVDDEQLEVQTEPLSNVEPDPGWAGSPRLAERAQELTTKLRRELDRLPVLKPPEVATRGRSAFSRRGDLGVQDKRSAADTIDRLAGMDVDEIKTELQRGAFHLRTLPSIKPRRGEVVLEWALPSQHADSAEQMLARMALDPRTSQAAQSLTVGAQARYSPEKPPRSAVHAVRLDSMTRSSGILLQWRTRDQAAAKAMAEMLLSAEQGSTAPVRRAVEAAEITLSGDVEAQGYEAGFRVEDKRRGRTLVRLQKKSLAGQPGQSVQITRNLKSKLR